MTTARTNAAFTTEARERLEEASRLLAEIGRAPSAPAAHIEALFRQLHTLKGLFADEARPEARLAHAAEQVVGSWRPQTPVDAGPVLEALDLMAGGLERDLPSSTLDAVAARLLTSIPGRETAPLGPYRPTEFPGPHTRIVVRISLASAAPAARAFLALRTLASLGRVLESYPTAQQLKEGRLPAHRLVVTLEGAHELTAVEAKLARHAEIEGVERDRSRTAAPPPATPTNDEAMRVSVAVLDQLLELSSEVVASSGRLERLVPSSGDGLHDPMRAETERLKQLARRLDLAVSAARETRAGSLVERLQRSVRELSRRTGKELELRVEGAELPMDRRIADALTEPLTHALRNAADHGIEPGSARRAAGKPEAGRLRLVFERSSDRMRVEVSDDGRGFDLTEIKRKAVEQGRIDEQAARLMDEAQTLQLAFLPGLSTRAEPDEISGRGVGMDALLRAVEGLGGSVSLSSTRGSGSRLTMTLPASLTATPLMIVRAAGATWALPVSRVRRVLDERPVAADGTVPSGRARLSADALATLLGATGPSSPPRRWLVVEREGTEAAIGVEEVVGQHDAVLQPVPPPLESVRGLAGAALLPGGDPVAVLDVGRLWGDAALRTRTRPPIPEALKPPLQEGFAHASEALRKLLAPARAAIGFPMEMPGPAGLAPKQAAAALFDVPGRVGLRIALVATEEAAAELASELWRRHGHDLDAAARDAFLELGNVLCSAFVNGLAAKTGATLVPSVPAFARGRAGPLMDEFSAGAAVMSMSIDWRTHRPAGALIVALDPGAIDALATAARTG